MSIEVQEAPKFKVGDRVRSISERYIDHKRARDKGWIGKIEGPAASFDFGVRWESGEIGCYNAADLAPAGAPAATPPRTITLDGVTYTLTPVAEAPAEEKKRKPQQGEVWRDDEARLILVTDEVDEDGDPQCAVLTGGSVGLLDAWEKDGLTYAYPTLAAAIAAGVLN